MSQPTDGVSRRGFLGGAASLGLAVGAGLPGRLAGAAPPKLNVAVIGLGGMGNGHLGALLGSPRVTVTAVCDVDAGRLRAAQARTDGRAKGYRDYREVLADRAIDAVWIATPDHWHAPITVEACRTGKDVYLEKPLGHNLVEGRRVVEAARQYGSVVQLGTQQRSQRHFQRVVEIVRSGQLGAVRSAHCWQGPSSHRGKGPDTPPPDELDYDLWLGPAPYRPFNPGRLHGVWRYFFDYGGGLMTDWGVHLIDIVLWATDDYAPSSVAATGTIAADSHADTPETMAVDYQFAGWTLRWTQDRQPNNDPERHGYGIVIKGERGELFCDRGGYRLYGVEERPAQPGEPAIADTGGHHDNFLDCVHSRRAPVCDIAVGHASTAVCHLGNIAYRTGRTIRWDAASETIVGDEAAGRLLYRVPRAPWGV